MPKNNALQKIESHEKLCRIMQKLTHKKIHSIEERVKRLEKILIITYAIPVIKAPTDTNKILSTLLICFSNFKILS